MLEEEIPDKIGLRNIVGDCPPEPIVELSFDKLGVVTFSHKNLVLAQRLCTIPFSQAVIDQGNE